MISRRKFLVTSAAAALALGVTPAFADTKKTIVLTSYGPFGSRTHNTSGEVARRAVELLKDEFNVVYKEIPTEWGSFESNLRSLVKENSADTIVSVGETNTIGGVPNVELRAFNKRSAYDAAHVMGQGEVISGGPNRLDAPDANRAALDAARKQGARMNPSYNAGTYLCNAALYTNLTMVNEGVVRRGGFVHVNTRDLGAREDDRDANALAVYIRNLAA